jgi:hypothetical protein
LSHLKLYNTFSFSHVRGFAICNKVAPRREEDIILGIVGAFKVISMHTNILLGIGVCGVVGAR